MADLFEKYDQKYFWSILLLLPGFLSYEIIAIFSRAPELGEFELLAACLSFSLINYFFAEFIYFIGTICCVRSENERRGLTLGYLSVLLGVTLLTGTVSAYINDSDALYGLYRNTSKISLERPFIKTLRECRPAFAKVYLSDGRKYSGFVVLYSEAKSDIEIVLNRATSYQADNSEKEYEAERHVVLFGKDIVTIEILSQIECNPGAKE